MVNLLLEPLLFVKRLLLEPGVFLSHLNTCLGAYDGLLDLVHLRAEEIAELGEVEDIESAVDLLEFPDKVRLSKCWVLKLLEGAALVLVRLGFRLMDHVKLFFPLVPLAYINLIFLVIRRILEEVGVKHHQLWLWFLLRLFS